MAFRKDLLIIHFLRFLFGVRVKCYLKCKRVKYL
jgi:hypothetical protein